MASVLHEIVGSEALVGGASAFDVPIGFNCSSHAVNIKGLAATSAYGNSPGMDNSIGAICCGWPATREGYAKLLDGTVSFHATFHDFNGQGEHDLHIFVGRERGICRTQTASLDLRMRTMRWIIKIDRIWQQLHHTMARSTIWPFLPTSSGRFSVLRSADLPEVQAGGVTA